MGWGNSSVIKVFTNMCGTVGSVPSARKRKSASREVWNTKNELLFMEKVKTQLRASGA